MSARVMHRLIARSRVPDGVLAGNGLFGRFGYLLASQSVILVGGLGYWAIATRSVQERSVGIASAAVSTATLLSSLGVLGIGSLFLAEMRTQAPGDQRRIVTTGAAVAGIAAAIFALCLSSFLGHLGPSLRAVGEDPVDLVLFVTGASVNAIGVVLDCAAIGIRRPPAQLARNLVAAALRTGLTALAVGLAWRDATTLLAAWVGAGALSLVVSWSLLGLTRGVAPSPSHERRALVRTLGPVALRHHVLNLAITSVTFFLPVIAALTVDPPAYAFFAVAQIVAACVLIPPALLAMALFAEATGDDALLHRQTRRTLPIAFGCCALALIFVEPFAHLALAPFGRAYAEASATPLRLLVLGGVPYVIKDHFVAIRRAQRRLTDGARAVAVATLLEVIGAATGAALHGVDGLCIGWVCATYLEAVRFAPVVVRVVATAPPQPPVIAGEVVQAGAGAQG